MEDIEVPNLEAVQTIALPSARQTVLFAGRECHVADSDYNPYRNQKDQPASSEMTIPDHPPTPTDTEGEADGSDGGDDNNDGDCHGPGLLGLLR